MTETKRIKPINDKSMLYALCSMLLIIAVDQITKGYFLYLLTGGIPLYGRAFDIVPFPFLMSRVTSFFNFVFTWNPGTSFSLFRNLGEAAPLALIVITGVIIGFFAHMLYKSKDRWERVALTLIVGGALGNLVDRIRFGAVVDFLDFHYAGWHWPAFNFADICITAGVMVFIAHWIFRKK
ncbi:MAG: signal peptidase II [Alphaproteobacteria bacterium]|nr:signal peptidase II [Alphaproteobacteria bacterium]